jgi:hypothetical protein
MALVNCRECGTAVSKKARTCPHCGISNPGTSIAAKAGFFSIIAIIIAGLFSLSKGAHNPASAQPNIEVAAANVQPAKAEQADAGWMSQHGDDPKALDDRFSGSAQAACSSGSDEYLKGIASYNFAWDKNAEGFFGDKFDKFSLRSAGSGMLSLLSTRAKLSNGFGAFQKISFYCLYDANRGEVVRYSLFDPSFDAPTKAAAATSSLPKPRESNSAPRWGAGYDGSASRADNALLRQEEALNDECRGYIKNVDAVCAARDRADKRLAQAGWCYGRPSDRSAVDSYWHKCLETGADNMPQALKDWVGACKTSLENAAIHPSRYHWSPLSQVTLRQNDHNEQILNNQDNDSPRPEQLIAMTMTMPFTYTSPSGNKAKQLDKCELIRNIDGNLTVLKTTITDAK